ncbi:MAG: hypothetical protein WBY94_24030 [Polyangiaceae bacterium]
MDAHKLQLKIFLDANSARAVELDAFVRVFHHWIKAHVLPELLIDVANYAHVPEGPGVVLIGHGSDYFMDQGEGRLGLLYNRKRAGAPPADRLADLARRALHAASLLEHDAAFSGKLRFAPNDMVFRVNDRLVAANDDATFAAVRSELEALARRLFAGPFELTRTGSPKELFTVRLTSPTQASLETLLERMGGPPAA